MGIADIRKKLAAVMVGVATIEKREKQCQRFAIPAVMTDIDDWEKLSMEFHRAALSRDPTELMDYLKNPPKYVMWNGDSL